jgi:uncharacterized delta-60 repeat protein
MSSLSRLLLALAVLGPACGNVVETQPDAPTGGDAPAQMLGVAVDPELRFVRRDEQLAVEVVVDRRGATGPVTIELAAMAGLSAAPLALPAGVDRGELALRAAADAALARATLEVVATAEGARGTAPLPVEVIGAPGTLDPGFGTSGVTTFAIEPGGLELPVFAIAQGEHVVVGVTVVRGGKHLLVVVRRDRTGAADPAFGTAGQTVIDFSLLNLQNPRVQAATQEDGKIVIAGSASNGSDGDPYLVRLLPDGLVDNSLALKKIDATTQNLSIDALAIGPGGEIVVCGARELSSASDAILMRLDANGARDAGFGNNGIATFNALPFDRCSALAVQADGRIAAMISTSNGNQFEVPQFALRRFGTDGVIDMTFGTAGTAALPTPEGFASPAALVTPDRLNLVVAGSVRTLAFGGGDAGVWRFLANGQLDLGFAGTGLYAAPATQNFDGLTAMTLAPDGSVYGVGMEVESFVTVRNNLLLHLDGAGVPDAALGPLRDTTATGTPTAIVLRRDRRLIVLTRPAIPDASADTTLRAYYR